MRNDHALASLFAATFIILLSGGCTRDRDNPLDSRSGNYHEFAPKASINAVLAR